jgi:hypothetical protein
VQKDLVKTYNSGYSLVVTHLTTNPPVRCLNRAERTGSLVFNVLWSYVEENSLHLMYDLSNILYDIGFGNKTKCCNIFDGILSLAESHLYIKARACLFQPCLLATRKYYGNGLMVAAEWCR